jgi:SAM-dependent methyltransferase
MERVLDPREFYDGLADRYHLIFENWDLSIAHQADALASVLQRWPTPRRRILDAAIGIGTQALGLATRGFHVVGSDIAVRALLRARRESHMRRVPLDLAAADFRALPFRSHFADIALACDNALPHLLSLAGMRTAIMELARCARPGGGVVISMRDYTPLPPGTRERRPYGEREWNGHRYRGEQEWEWHGSTYTLTLRLEPLGESHDERIELRTEYFAVSIDEVLQLMRDAGLNDVQRVDGVFYQPLLIGTA